MFKDRKLDGIPVTMPNHLVRPPLMEAVAGSAWTIPREGVVVDHEGMVWVDMRCAQDTTPDANPSETDYPRVIVFDEGIVLDVVPYNLGSGLTPFSVTVNPFREGGEYFPEDFAPAIAVVAAHAELTEITRIF